MDEGNNQQNSKRAIQCIKAIECLLLKKIDYLNSHNPFFIISDAFLNSPTHNIENYVHLNFI